MPLVKVNQTCENCGIEAASACAALTDSDSVLLAHRFICHTCAQLMFSVKVNQTPVERRLEEAINRVKAKSSSNERVADDEKVLDEIL